ncbi:hypothetical protein G9A89_000573 [Geosiphon pyriformis]|nr:hypothetical protein G9A89_000573 [Geosiphon pyriformis]
MDRYTLINYMPWIPGRTNLLVDLETIPCTMDRDAICIGLHGPLVLRDPDQTIGYPAKMGVPELLDPLKVGLPEVRCYDQCGKGSLCLYFVPNGMGSVCQQVGCDRSPTSSGEGYGGWLVVVGFGSVWVLFVGRCGVWYWGLWHLWVGGIGGMVCRVFGSISPVAYWYWGPMAPIYGWVWRLPRHRWVVWDPVVGGKQRASMGRGLNGGAFCTYVCMDDGYLVLVVPIATYRGGSGCVVPRALLWVGHVGYRSWRGRV